MNEQIEVNINKPGFSILPDDEICCIGSCFSSEISACLKNKGIFVLSNPFGTIYNTYSIFRVFDDLFNIRLYDEKDLICYNGRYLSLNHSTDFDGNDKEKCLKKINDNIIRSADFIKKARVFIVTPGTSAVWIYENMITANCHKIMQDKFIRKLLSYEENLDLLKKIIILIKLHIKDPKIIFTLSPVRHNKYDLVENSYSKSLLRGSIGQLIDNKSVFYFPSYEMVMDQFRDYSYYKKDKIHLKKRAIEYISDKFINNYMDQKAIDYIQKFVKIKNVLLHKTGDAGSDKTLSLLRTQTEKLKEIETSNNQRIMQQLKYVISLRLLKFIDNKDIKIILLNLFNVNSRAYKLLKLIIEKDVDKVRNFRTGGRMLNKIKYKFLLKSLRDGF